VRKIITSHRGLLSDLKFSGDNRVLAATGSISADLSNDALQLVQLWDPKTGEEVRGIRLDRKFVYINALSFSPDGQLLAGAGNDKSVRLWNCLTGEQVRSIGHNEPVSGIAFSPNGLLASCAEKIVRLCDPMTGEEIRRLGHTESVSSIAFSSNGLFASAHGKYVSLWT
jgi:WD40 repeat protein